MRNMTGASESTGKVPIEPIVNSVQKSKGPVSDHSMTMPTTKPTSPSLVIQNALAAARAALGRSYQDPLRRQEQSPTSSQKTNNCKNVGESTSPSIEKENSDW